MLPITSARQEDYRPLLSRCQFSLSVLAEMRERYPGALFVLAISLAWRRRAAVAAIERANT